MGLICYMTYVPLFGGLENLVLAVAGYVVLFAHWLMNKDTCVLTLVEQHLRGVPKGDTFLQSLVGPVYGLGGSRFVWAVSILLFGLAVLRLREELKAHGV